MVEDGRGHHLEDSRPNLSVLIPEVDRSISELLHTDSKIFVASTGAGAGITQLIWRVPGISRILIGTAFPYHRNEFRRFIGREHEGPYVSEDAALALSNASYERVISAGDPEPNTPIGIGLTAAVSTLTNQDSQSRVIIAARTSAKTTVVSVTMERNYLDRVNEGAASDLLVLNMILHVAGVRQVSLPDLRITSNELILENGRFILQPKEKPL